VEIQFSEFFEIIKEELNLGGIAFLFQRVGRNGLLKRYV
jgi:hypothetical protein